MSSETNSCTHSVLQDHTAYKLGNIWCELLCPVAEETSSGLDREIITLLGLHKLCNCKDCLFICLVFFAMQIFYHVKPPTTDTLCDGSTAGVSVFLRGDEASKSEGWSLSLTEPWQDPWAQIESRRVWSSFSELLLFNCDLQECVRYGNLSRNSRYGLSKSTLWNKPLHPVGRINL